MWSYKWNGRFVRKKVYEAMLRRSENAKNRLTKLKAKKLEEAEKSDCVVQGSRIST